MGGGGGLVSSAANPAFHGRSPRRRCALVEATGLICALEPVRVILYVEFVVVVNRTSLTDRGMLYEQTGGPVYLAAVPDPCLGKRVIQLSDHFRWAALMVGSGHVPIPGDLWDEPVRA